MKPLLRNPVFALALLATTGAEFPAARAAMPELRFQLDGPDLLLGWDAAPLNPGSATELFYGFQLEESSDLENWNAVGAPIASRVGGGAVAHEVRLPRAADAAFYRLALSLDLDGADLRDTNLAGIDFSGADLEGADLSGSDLRGADLYGASFRDLTLLSLGGPDETPVRESVPEMPFANGGAAYSDNHAELSGIEISHNTILLAFKPDTTTAEANAVLATHGARIVGSIPSPDPTIPAILVLELPTDNHQQLGGIVPALRNDPEVECVAENALLGLDAVPNDDFFENPEWPWTPGMDPPLGNWGMRAARIPQMWNFNTKIQQMIADGERDDLIAVGVFDAGFDPNGDFNHPVRVGNVKVGGHGAHVMGIIGSSFSFGPPPDDSLAIDGVNPFARIYYADVSGDIPGVDLSELEGGEEDDLSFFSFAEVVMQLNGFVEAAPKASIINISLGHGWHKRRDNKSTPMVVEDHSRNPMLEGPIQQLVREEANFRDLLWSIKARVGAGPLIISSAGNSSNFFDRNAVLGGVDARWNSPWNYSALANGDANVLVVEASKNEAGDYYLHSCLGGHVKAPGEKIYSSVTPTAKNGNALFRRLTGTSMATPHVTGVASYMRMIEPTLSNAQIRNILMRRDGVTEMGAPLNGFAAVMDIDRITGGTEVLRMLVDVDDNVINGTVGQLKDGNTRVERLASTAETDPPSPPRETIFAKPADEREGDSRVDMADFRRWRDWLLQSEEGWDSPLIGLDGAASGNPHYKMDLNADGTVDDMARENMFPRGDFNGDGEIHRHKQVYVPGAMSAPASDFEVLRFLFQEDEYWSKFDLELLFDSFDLHVSLYEIYRHNWKPENADLQFEEIFIEFSSGDPGFKEGAYPVRVPVPPLAPGDPTARNAHLILTLPTPPVRYRPIVYGRPAGAAPDEPEWLDEPRVDAKPGADIFLVPKLKTDLVED